MKDCASFLVYEENSRRFSEVATERLAQLAQLERDYRDFHECAVSAISCLRVRRS
jgi:hypothetical protein